MEYDEKGRQEHLKKFSETGVSVASAKKLEKKVRAGKMLLGEDA